MSTKGNTGPYRKTAISVPAELLAGVDEAARARGESRSAFIARVLRAAVRSRRDAAITRRLDEMFAGERVAQEQRQEAEDLGGAGSVWTDEGW